MNAHELAEQIRCAPVRENARGVLCSMVPTNISAELYDLLVSLPYGTSVDQMSMDEPPVTGHDTVWLMEHEG